MTFKLYGIRRLPANMVHNYKRPTLILGSVEKSYKEISYMPYKLVLILKERLAVSEEESKITLRTDAFSNKKNEKNLYNSHSK